MNSIAFVSLLLVFSTAVVAFPGAPGAPQKADINSPAIQELAKKVVTQKFAADSGSGCTQKVNNVLEATTKVVAGSLTDLKMEICPDTCSNGAAKSNECKTCIVQVWEKPWENFFEITKFEC